MERIALFTFYFTIWISIMLLRLAYHLDETNLRVQNLQEQVNILSSQNK